MQELLFTFSSLRAILDPLNWVMHGDIAISTILTDSRSLLRAEGVLFVALRTSSGDGHRYIGELYQRGVRAYLVEEMPEAYAEAYPNANFVCVRNALSALQRIARHHREHFTIPVVGITGSNGKTIVKEFMHTLLGDVAGRVFRSPRSYNSQIGVPLSLLQLSHDDQMAIIEAGISMPGEMSRLSPIIAPTMGILTSIGSAHSEHFASQTALLEEKLRLFAQANVLVAPMDIPNLREAINTQGLQCRLMGWSKVDKRAFVFVRKVEISQAGAELCLEVAGTQYQGISPLTDNASIENALTALCAIAALHLEWLPHAIGRLPLLRPVSMRMEVKESYRGNIIINDAYCNDLDSLRIALDFQRRRIHHSGHRAVVVLSDIEQSSLEAEALYRILQRLLCEYGVAEVYTIGEHIAHLHHTASPISIHHYESTEALLASSALKRMEHTCILLKGARRFGFERIYRELSRLEHQTTLEIDLSAVRHNLAYYRSLLPARHRLICMIKADGYGIGAVELARTLQESRVNYLAVAAADEGKALRLSGISSPIIVMNPALSSSDTLFRHGLEPEVYSLSLLKELTIEAQRCGIEGYPIHLKIDTGMHRLGLTPSELDEALSLLGSSSTLRVASVFSHLAAADEPTLDDYTHKQAQALEVAYRRVEQVLGYRPLLHLLNSAGIERFCNQYAYDAVRLGIGLYGSTPTKHSSLKPVARLVTTILQIRHLDQGSSVGYGCRGRVSSPSRIAVLPIGYADGLRRVLSNGSWQVEIHGKLCPIVGNICMDTCMVDVTEVIDATEGDQVVIFGSNLCSLERMAEAAGTISYEILTTLSLRIQRLYYQE